MMPIIVKDFTWQQTATTIYLTVKMNGVRRDKTSFVTGDNYIRLHYPPFYFEVFLWGDVDEVNGKCTLDEKESLVVFEMPKQIPNVEWPSLDVKDLNRLEKHEKRIRAVDLSQKRAKEQLEEALARRRDQKQMSIHEQLRLDDEARARIASIKSFDTRTALEQLREWQRAEGGNLSSDDEFVAEAEAETENPIDPTQEVGKETKTDAQAEAGGDASVNTHENDEKDDSSSRRLSQPIKSNRDNGEPEPELLEPETNKGLELSKEKNVDEAKKPISERKTKTSGNKSSSSSGTTNAPDSGKASNYSSRPIRSGGSISVSFTPREFPTPSRESTALEEEEWLKKQREALRKSGFNDADLRPEERDPTWLLEKGESLMKTESYLGAVSAFTTGLKIAPKMPELYFARAASHFALSNYRKAVEDSSQALEMFTPKCCGNAVDRKKAHTCRGNAFYKLKMYSEALGDLSEALKLDPTNSKLKEDVQNAQVEVDKEALRGDSSEDEQ